MNYYYDLKLNFQKNNCLFYEWSNIDKIEVIKKIPIIHISTNVMEDILSNKIVIDMTTINNKDLVLFVSKNNAIALKFSLDGNEMYRSQLLLEDEANVIEVSGKFNNYDIKYKVLEPIKYNAIPRKELIIKDVIKKEIKYLLDNKDYKKLDYLYMEWFDKRCNNYNLIENDINTKLSNGIGNKELSIYNLIILSYKKV